MVKIGGREMVNITHCLAVIYLQESRILGMHSNEIFNSAD